MYASCRVVPTIRFTSLLAPDRDFGCFLIDPINPAINVLMDTVSLFDFAHIVPTNCSVSIVPSMWHLEYSIPMLIGNQKYARKLFSSRQNLKWEQGTWNSRWNQSPQHNTGDIRIFLFANIPRSITHILVLSRWDNSTPKQPWVPCAYYHDPDNSSDGVSPTLVKNTTTNNIFYPGRSLNTESCSPHLDHSTPTPLPFTKAISISTPITDHITIPLIQSLDSPSTPPFYCDDLTDSHIFIVILSALFPYHFLSMLTSSFFGALSLTWLGAQ